VEKYGRAGQATDDNIVRRMRLECRITMARIQTHNHNIQITAFAWQQWFRERASVLRHTYIASLVLM
jgi:hypothetical protein